MKPAAPPGSKASIRIAALEARSALDEAARTAASVAVAERALQLVPPGARVALYAPLRGELDCMPLAGEAFHGRVRRTQAIGLESIERRNSVCLASGDQQRNSAQQSAGEPSG